MSTPFLRVRPWNFAHTRVHCAPAEPITNECVFFLFSFLVRYLGLYICWGIFGVLRDPTFSAGKNKKHIRKRLGKGTLNTCANFSGSKADDIGNAMSQSYLPKLFKKKPAEDTLVPPLWGTREENVFFLRIICSRCCTRRNLRFHVENRQQADQKQLTRR